MMWLLKVKHYLFFFLFFNFLNKMILNYLMYIKEGCKKMDGYI